MAFIDPDSFKDPDTFQDPDQNPTSVWEDVKIAGADALDTLGRFGAGTEGAIRSLFGDIEGADAAYKAEEEMRKKRQKAANPEGKAQRFKDKAIGLGLTLPLQLATFPFSPATTGQTAVDEGESLSRAMMAAGIDTAGNMIGVGLPGSMGTKLLGKATSGAAINAGQDAVTKALIAEIMQTPGAKEKLGPSLESAGLSAMLGAAMGPLTPTSQKAAARPVDADTALRNVPQPEVKPEVDQAYKRYQHGIEQPNTDIQQIKVLEDFLKSYEAQKAIEQRQAALEQEVAQKQSLDFNAAERARQEAAPTGYESWVESQRNDIAGDPGINDPINWPRRKADRFPEMTTSKMEGKPDYNPLDPGINDQRALPVEIADMLRTGDRTVDPFDRYSPKQEANRILIEGKKATIRKGRGPSRGAIDPRVFEDLYNFGKSIVRGADGLLKPVYHGTTKVIDGAFKTAKGFKSYYGDKGGLVDGFIEPPKRAYPGDLGSWFSDTPQGTDTFAGTRTGVSGGNVHQAYLNLENPKVFATHGDFIDWFHEKTKNGESASKVRRSLVKEGFDGIQITESMTDGGGVRTDYVAFDPKKIESAISPSGEKYSGRFNKQRGGIDPDLLTLGVSKLIDKFNSEGNKKFVADLMGTKLYQEAVSGETVIAAAKQHGKDATGSVVSKPTTYWAAGATLEAYKRNSPLVLGGSRIIQRAKTIAEDHVRTNIFPVENSLRKTKAEDLKSLAQFMKGEQLQRTRKGVETLIKEGSSPEAALAYEKLRKMQDKTGTYLNKIREAQGKPPISLEDAYMTSVWQGDFRRAIYNSDGKLVWMLGANTKRGLNEQTKALFKAFPELKNGKYSDGTLKHNKYGMDANTVFKEMVEILGSDDPAVQKIKEWADNQTIAQGGKAFGEEKHFEKKANVRGFVGDRPGKTNVSEASAYMQAQIDVAKQAYKWGELQLAAMEMKKIFNDPELAIQQPNNIRFLKEYWLDNLGMNDSKISAAVDNTLRDAGLTPSAVGEGINTVKSLWITQKLLSSGYYLSNILQSAHITPHITDIMSKYGGNPIVAIPFGIMGGLATASGHWLSAKGSPEALYKSSKALGLDDFSVRAMKYAEDNSITTRSIYDEAPVEKAYTARGKAARVATQVISAPETLLRSFAFMTYAKMLETSGKFTNDMDIFRLAEERVNMSMGDYREGERALAFGKMGTVGTAANTLSTFPINYFNQWSWASREAGRGNPAPLVAMFATNYVLAGAMGIPGFEDLDRLWNYIKDQTKDINPKLWDKIRKIDLKQVVREAGGDISLYGAPSVLSGVAMTSRSAAPVGAEMSITPGAPFIDFAQQGVQWLDALASGSDPTKWAEAAYSSAPVGLQGAMETSDPMRSMVSIPATRDGEEGRVYGKPKDISDRSGQVFRTKEDEDIRKLGLRSQREQVERDSTYRAQKQVQDVNDVVRELPNKVYHNVRIGNMDKAKDYMQLYTKLSGKGMTEEQFTNMILKESTTGSERLALRTNTVEGLIVVKRLRQLLKEQQNEEVQR